MILYDWLLGRFRRNDADGTGGAGDMLKSIYDTNGNNSVDNSEALNGQSSSWHLDRTNHSGTQLANTISDLQTSITNNVTVQANTSKVSADGSVATHSDVTNAGSGLIITSAERSLLNSMALVEKDEGDGPGFIINSQDRTEHDPIGWGTLDLSTGDSDLNPRGITGQQAFGIGYNIRGDGYAAITAGWDHNNNGNYSVVNGISNDTAGGGALLVGVALDNTGGDNLAIFGKANALPTGNPFALIIGNGQTQNNLGGRAIGALTRSNSLQVHKNTGAVEMPSLTITDIENIISKKVAVTKEWYESRNKYRFAVGTIHLIGQTTVALMNQQACVLAGLVNFEEYLTISFTPDVTDNYQIGTSFLWSLNNQANKFLGVLQMDDGITTNDTVFAVEPKDASGAGVLVDVVQANSIQPQVNTSTDSKHPETFIFNETLQAGTTYTFKLFWGCQVALLRATIYNAQIWVEQKTAI